jgi:hypothetical protein
MGTVTLLLLIAPEVAARTNIMRKAERTFIKKYTNFRDCNATVCDSFARGNSRTSR